MKENPGAEARPLLARLVYWSIQRRLVALAMLGILLAGGAYAAKTLPIDALPDLSTVQVTVLTTASGLDPETVEGTVTTPLENALNGIGTSCRSAGPNCENTGLSSLARPLPYCFAPTEVGRHRRRRTN